MLLEHMLVSAVLYAEPNGGEVVYTTRTLNPVHNEFVVQFAMETLREKFNVEVSVETEQEQIFMHGMKDNFHFEQSTSLGMLVAPTLFKNNGPRYLCKLKRRTDSLEIERYRA